MGHRFSKTTANNIATPEASYNSEENSTTNSETTSNTLQQQSESNITHNIPIPSPPNGANSFEGPNINLQIQKSLTAIPANSTCCSPTTAFSTSLAFPASTTTTAVVTAAPNNILQQHPSSTGSGGCGSSSSLTSVNNLSCGRQIIIKIQLAKMETENGNNIQQQQQQRPQPHQQGSCLEEEAADCNLNSCELLTRTTNTTNAGAAQVLNLTLNSNGDGGGGSSSCDTTRGSCHTHIMTTTPNNSSTSTILRRTAGSSPPMSSSPSSPSISTTNNNYLNPSGKSINFSSSMDASTRALTERLGRLNTLQFNDEIVEQNIGEIVEYCEVLDEQLHPQQLPTPPILPISHEQHMSTEDSESIDTNACCRRKSKSLAANGGSSSANTKRRCRKCSCRDAFRRILDPSLSRSSNKANKQQQQLERKEQNSKLNSAQERHSISNPLGANINPISTTSTMMAQRNSIHSTLVVPTPSGATAAAMMAAAAAASSSSSVAASTGATTNQLAVWAPVTTMSNGSDVIIPLTSPPQFVVVQCAIVNPSPPHPANSNLLTSGLPPPNSIISITPSATNNDIMVKVPLPNNTSSQLSSVRSSPPANGVGGSSTVMGPIVHSQVDFVHYLVPDLERITNSSFYWGKMDRYEAERLLEGKPEGTFLLRDSAQEEFLFSVTFRKYGRSLHARIEQSGHQFSFDCHDPCVFTAPTVSGLLEHYKDPACVMFFEPMLTIPLHRKNCFTLQKLCRATIVSNTTYDGINELELPARLKSFLKEYHYKQKLRVKSNEPTYTIHCK